MDDFWKTTRRSLRWFAEIVSWQCFASPFALNMHGSEIKAVVILPVFFSEFLLIDEQSRIERIIYRDFRAQSKKNTPLHKRCAFIMSKEPALRIPYGMAFPKGSPYKPLFDPV